MNRAKSIVHLPLGMVLTLPFAALLAGTVTLIAFFSVTSSSETSSALIRRLSSELTREATNELDRIMEYPLLLNSVNANALDSGLLNPGQPSTRDPYFARQLLSFPQVSYAFYGLEDGSFYGARRDEKDQVEVIHNDRSTGGNSRYYSIDSKGFPLDMTAEIKNFDCRTRPWYKAGQAAGQAVYSEIYRHFVYQDLAITAARPVYHPDGSLAGVLGVDFRLDRINAFLQTMLPVPGSTMTVLERSTGLLVGNSLGQKNYRIQDGTFTRLTLADLDHPWLARVFADTHASSGPNPGNPDSPAVTSSHADSHAATGGELIHLESRSFTKYGLDWLVLVTLPDSAFTQAITANARTTLVICLATLLAAILFGILVAKRVMVPLNQVVEAARLIAGGKWDYPPPDPSYRELHTLAQAFASMAAQLQASFNGLESTVATRTRELAAKNTELQLANATKDRFMAILAHDLRGPISSQAKLLEELACGSLCIDKEELPQLLDGLATSSRNIQLLLENLLTWAMAQRREIRCTPEVLDLDALVAETNQLLAGQAGNKNITLSAQTAGIQALGDPQMIRTVHRNLVANAIKFTPEGGSIRTSIQQDGHQAVVTVQDTGIGMDQELLARLFQTDAVNHRRGTQGETGTGLGLLLCKEFVEQNQGSIEVTSQPGSGSSFSFRLPLAP